MLANCSESQSYVFLPLNTLTLLRYIIKPELTCDGRSCTLVSNWQADIASCNPLLSSLIVVFLSLCGLGDTPALPTGYNPSKRVRSFLNDVLAADTTNPGLQTLSVEVDEFDNQILQLHTLLFMPALNNQVVKYFDFLPIYNVIFVWHRFATRKQGKKNMWNPSQR